MKERFRGKALLDAILRQDLVTCDARAARHIAKICRVVDIRPCCEFIREGDASSDVFLILQGTADIRVKGSLVATRAAGQHIGEIAPLLNSRRTASVIARDHIVAAKLSRSAFLALGKKFTGIWREVARELALRLDQRRNLIREPNLRAQVFIASATESKDVAYQLKAGLSDVQWDVEVWDEDQVFPPSKTFIEALREQAQRSDFGIVVFGRDDKTTSRKKRKDAPRDNTVLEGGLFIGAIGLERTYFLVPEGKDFKKPTDLDGVVMLSYRKTARKIDVQSAASRIRKEIERRCVR